MKRQEIAKFTPQEMREYETSKMAYRDIKNSVDTAKQISHKTYYKPEDVMAIVAVVEDRKKDMRF